ncbi:MAG: hypothetical protein A2669_01945 [Candidatus Yanofskybacteria bacterium RIFCSPHIGHO2_01_FULL_48_25b]|uniref:Uncharacterized protein n=1 Tax=Candidatus Yanofskybacteria bacterium RIFCSPHIGHO2_01_FULL_48_25b TaxID=1802672 RepID=A0A1F8F5C7_9BACT|nr:MAG: hypothetical protein A2669_01945 [Candidatus Yanofskybacteria bacterium RIFCSPHIGHO2_01_FULL_48_25b]
MGQFLFLALPDLFRKIICVETGNSNLHVPDKVVVSFCIAVKPEVFLNKMNLSFYILFNPVVNYRRIFKIASEAVYLFTKNHRYFMGSCKLQHLHKTFSDLLATG